MTRSMTSPRRISSLSSMGRVGPPSLTCAPLAGSGAVRVVTSGWTASCRLCSGGDMRGRQREEAGEKPELRAVLEHYGARLGQRNSQMVQCVFTEVHADETPSMSVNL